MSASSLDSVTLMLAVARTPPGTNAAGAADPSARPPFRDVSRRLRDVAVAQCGLAKTTPHRLPLGPEARHRRGRDDSDTTATPPSSRDTTATGHPTPSNV